MKEFVIPGDVYNPNSQDSLEVMDSSLIKHNKKYVFTVSGDVIETSPLLIETTTSSQYFPIIDHPIIGVVESFYQEGYQVNIRLADLAYLAQNQAHKIELQKGQIISGVITRNKIGHQVEIKLVSLLKDGYLYRISPHLAVQLLLDDRLQQISKYYKYNIQIGVNGFVYITECTQFDAQGIYECVVDSKNMREIITKRRLLLQQASL